MTFGKKYSKYSIIEFACFSFRVGLLFINFSTVAVLGKNIWRDLAPHYLGGNNG